MEVYILDSLLRRETLIDRFESLIWAERFNSFGDFELTLRGTKENRATFPQGTKLAMNESHRVMTVETVENKVDSEGKSVLSIKGRSLEAILEDRVARQNMSDLTTNPSWVLTGTPGDVARYIFQKICREGILDAADVIPFLVPGTMFPASTIPEPDTSVTVTIEPTTVYQAIKNICDLYGMGFRLTRNYDTSQLFFDIYMGSDRTTQQSTLPAVVFSPSLDNLQNTTELTTSENYKNVAYVFSPVGSEIVYADGVDPFTEGFERRVLMVRADDITSTVPATASALMIQRGLEELSKYRQYSAFDGEINRFSEYKYGTHYHLGDFVEMQTDTGFRNNMQVTEQIFASDEEGERSYPTLTVNKFITAGSWLGWDYNQVWQDLGLTEYWSNQP